MRRTLAVLVFGAALAAQQLDLRQPGFVEAAADGTRPGMFVGFDLDADGDLDLASDESIWRNDGEGRFARLCALPVTSVARLAAGDFDLDGDEDLLALAYRQLVLVRSDPTGFVAVTLATYPNLPGPTGMVVADVDGDQDLDVVLANWGYYQPHGGQLLVNDGAGNFTDNSAALPATTDHNVDVTAGDFDADGDLDLVFLLGNTVPQLHVLRNNGVGQFASWVRVSTTSTPLAVTVLDVDGDGDADLVTATTGGELLLRSNGAGQFAPAAAFAGAPPVKTGGLVAGDADGDGDLDLLTVADPGTGHGLGAPRLWRNDGTGSFTFTPQPWQAGKFAPAPPLLFDADGDGDLDVQFVSWPRGSLHWNDGTGAFLELDAECVGWNETEDSGTARSWLADLDGDGDLDLVRTTRRYGLSPTQSVDCWLNDDTGALGPRVEVLPSAADTGLVGCVDADGDGDLDLFVTRVVGPPGSRGPAWLVRNDGNGVFTALASAGPLAPAGQVRAGDLDGDGDADLVVGDGAGALCVLVAQGPFLFVDESAPRAAGAPAAWEPLLVDFDRDGDLDLALNPSTGGAYYFQNDGSGHFANRSATNMPAGFPGGYAWTTVDFDRDGDRDIIWGGNGARLLRNDNGVFVQVSGSLPNVGGLVYGIAVADLDGDRWEDLYAYTDAGMQLWRNDRQGTFVVATPPSVPAGFEGHTLLADLDRDGDVDAVVPLCVLTNGEHQLTNTVPPRVGYHGEIRIHVAEASPAAVVPVIVAVSLDRLATPRSYGDWGLYWIDPGSPWSWVDSTHFLAGPEEAMRYQVPNVPGLLGAELWLQSVVLHQFAFPHWRLSNHISLRLHR